MGAHDNLKDLIGTWIEDPEFDRAMAEQDQIDEELWRGEPPADFGLPADSVPSTDSAPPS